MKQSDLLATHARISPFIHRTPVLTSSAIDGISGASLFFKCENLQKMGAFKMRGGANAILQLTDGQRAKGVATHSSGNFAQAVALGAQKMGIPAYIVMPSNAPEVKKQAVKGYGGEVIECEPNLKARETTLAKVVERTGATPLHPYNHRDVILGQATAAMELIEDAPEMDYLLAPVGGGGLIAGTALAAHFFSPKTTVLGGEPAGADDAYRSLEAGKLIPQTGPDTIADGLLTSLGDQTFPIIQKHVKRIILVSDEEIVAALRLILERMKILIEPSCAVPLAAVLKEPETFAGKKVGIILSGGNVDLKRLGELF